jgi:hypothetical protein
MPLRPASAGVGVALALAFAVPLAAQQDRSATVGSSGGWFYDEPAGKRIARLESGTVLAIGEARSGWQSVTLRGVIWARSVGRAAGSDFDLRVTQRGQENLRDQPNGTILARLLEGFLLERTGAQGNWIRVERQGWVERSALGAVEGGSQEAETSGAAPGAGPAERLPAARVPGGTALRARPDGDTVALLPDSTSLRVVARQDDWVRVRVDGWVRAAELGTASAVELVTPADLRSDPDAYRGSLVRWSLRVIAVRTADELRPDIPTGRRYLLTRGPLPEGEYVYVILPQDRVAEAELLPPLSTIVVTGRVHAARARYLGNTVLELVDLQAGDRR